MTVVQQFVIVFPVIPPRGGTIKLTYIEIKRGPCKNRRATHGARSMYHWPKYLSVSTLGCDQVELLAKKYVGYTESNFRWAINKKTRIYVMNVIFYNLGTMF